VLICRGRLLNEPLSESRDAGNPPVRFDERDLETGLRATAPDLDSTRAKALVKFSRYGAAQDAAPGGKLDLSRLKQGVGLLPRSVSDDVATG